MTRTVDKGVRFLAPQEAFVVDLPSKTTVGAGRVPCRVILINKCFPKRNCPCSCTCHWQLLQVCHWPVAWHRSADSGEPASESTATDGVSRGYAVQNKRCGFAVKDDGHALLAACWHVQITFPQPHTARTSVVRYYHPSAAAGPCQSRSGKVAQSPVDGGYVHNVDSKVAALRQSGFAAKAIRRRLIRPARPQYAGQIPPHLIGRHWALE